MANGNEPIQSGKFIEPPTLVKRGPPPDPPPPDPTGLEPQGLRLILNYDPLPMTSPVTTSSHVNPEATANISFAPALAIATSSKLSFEHTSVLDSMFPFKRPLSGIEPFDTPTTIMVLKKSDSSIVYQTNKFILQSITKPQQERFQIIETFGKPHVFFYDERTKIYTLNGVMLDAFFFDGYTGDQSHKYRNMWALGFQDFYNKHLRGYELKRVGHIAALYVNGWLIKGYPIQFTISKESTQMPEAVSFQMTWVIENEILLNAKEAELVYMGTSFNKKLIPLINKLNKLLTEYGVYSAKSSLSQEQLDKARDVENEISAVKTEIQNQINVLKAQGSDSVTDFNYH